MLQVWTPGNGAKFLIIPGAGGGGRIALNR